MRFRFILSRTPFPGHVTWQHQERTRFTAVRLIGKGTDEEVRILVAMVEEDPHLALDDLVWAFRKRTGVTLSQPTIKIRTSAFAPSISVDPSLALRMT
jgi:hypothetical protein